MAFTVDELKQDDRFLSAILQGAHDLIAIYVENPRIASILASQQRWLLAHSAFALHLGYPGDLMPGLYSSRLTEFADRYNIASHNTAVAFLKEMMAYKFVQPVLHGQDRRITLLEPTEITYEYMGKWLYTHLHVLDTLDGGSRIAEAALDVAAIWKMQPHIAKRIVESKNLRNLGPTFNLFNFATSGGLVMDFLISCINLTGSLSDRIVIGPVSMQALQSQFMISRTHLKRLFRSAAELGSLGWVGVPGKSSFWISRNFVLEYRNYQAEKYAIVDIVRNEIFSSMESGMTICAES
ncbi:hypothetical protein [Rhizobium sp. RCAM05973]|uniref:hypothetical protein n=1 Tax=Rhizobium sp. RCAM05973 TaxID=2994066 RepID=UPI0022EBC72E|nr:hypothetical protein [Rhizobium sp. RCAM05973]